MTDEIRERLSALLDDELAPDEIGPLLDRLHSDEDLPSAWDAYHLIGDVMRGEGVRIAPHGVAESVRERLKSEPAIIAAPARDGHRSPPKVNHWAKPVIGAALAASVAVMAVYLLPQIPGIMDDSGVQTLASTESPSYLERTATRWKNLSEPKVESQLNRYLVDHNEFASSRGVSGVVPYTSFVTYDSNSSR